MTEEAERRARIAWMFLTEPGDGDAGELLAAYGPVEALDRVRSASFSRNDQRWVAARERWQPRLSLIDIDGQLRRAAKAHAHLIVPGDHSWPEGWDDLGVHAPIAVWMRGVVSPHPSIAVVGARAATGYGEQITAELVGDLASHDVSIVSGAAYGIDGSAHRVALATGMHTTAILAGGADRVYPAGHAGLLTEIARVGCVTSEMPLGAAPTRWRFLARNRLIAALGVATVVVEAGWRSGSLNTAGHAATLGRPLGAVPGPVTSAASAGCHRLLREYDAVCVTSGTEIAELAGLLDASADAWPVGIPGVADTSAGTGSDAARVMDSLSRTVARSIDDAAARAGLAIRTTQATLGLLELEGAVRREGENWLRGK